MFPEYVTWYVHVALLPAGDHPVDSSPGDIGLIVQLVETGVPRDTTPAAKVSFPLVWPVLLNRPSVTPATKVAPAASEARAAATVAARFALGTLMAVLRRFSLPAVGRGERGTGPVPLSPPFNGYVVPCPRATTSLAPVQAGALVAGGDAAGRESVVVGLHGVDSQNDGRRREVVGVACRGR